MDDYIIISPVKNEEEHIEKTLLSVVKQTKLPLLWIIVDDGSTDKTQEIVQQYEREYPFIKYKKTDSGEVRDFGSKVRAFNSALNQLKDINYRFIGNLDGDISFDSNYFNEIIKKFNENPRLGICGGKRFDFIDGQYVDIRNATDSVPGAFQLFRRECFEQIGGYRQMQYGGIDAVAEIMARMKGWEVRSFEELRTFHHKPTGSGSSNIIRSKLREGTKYHMIGYLPIFHIVRVISRMNEKPVFWGSLLIIAGYFWAKIRKLKSPLPEEFIAYIRKEQKDKLKLMFGFGGSKKEH